MRVPRTAVGTIVGLLALAAAGARTGDRVAAASPETSVAATASKAGSYTRYTRRLEDETVRILTPEIGGATKAPLAAHGLDLWSASSIGEWRQGMLRWAPTTEKALTVLVRRTEVLWAEERVDEPYGSTILQLGSVHAMQKGLARVLDTLGVASPAPVSAHGIGASSLAHLPTEAHVAAPAPAATPAPPPPAPLPATPHAYTMTPAPAPRPAPVAAPAPTAAPVSVAPAPAALPRPATTARSAAPASAPRRAAAPAAAGPARNLPPAQSPYELASYQGALAKESYRILFPEIENGAQGALAARRNEMRNASSVAEWKRLLSEANPAFAKAAAVLERRAEVLRGETRVLDAYDSPHTQRAAVYGLQSGLEKILALYGK